MNGRVALAPGPAGPARLAVEDRGSWAVLRPDGRLDLAAADALRRAALDLVDRGCVVIHLDLSGAEDPGWGAMGVIAGIDRLCVSQGGCLDWYGAGPDLDLVLHAAGIGHPGPDGDPAREGGGP